MVPDMALNSLVLPAVVSPSVRIAMAVIKSLVVSRLPTLRVWLVKLPPL
jgi:hypothetical protein